MIIKKKQHKKPNKPKLKQKKPTLLVIFYCYFSCTLMRDIYLHTFKQNISVKN